MGIYLIAKLKSHSRLLHSDSTALGLLASGKLNSPQKEFKKQVNRTQSPNASGCASSLWCAASHECLSISGNAGHNESNI